MNLKPDCILDEQILSNYPPANTSFVAHFVTQMLHTLQIDV